MGEHGQTGSCGNRVATYSGIWGPLFDLLARERLASIALRARGQREGSYDSDRFQTRTLRYSLRRVSPLDSVNWGSHNPKVGGSNPPPATKFFNRLRPPGPERSAHFPLILLAIARRPARARPVSGHLRLACKRSLSWRCWNASGVLAALSHRCDLHVAGKSKSAGTCATPRF